MRLHRLTARAFGPFADEVDIDFDRLSDAGIFLIHGPTGGGKTSILDALCFALYANVPGARPAGRSLRSHHAAPTIVPTVTVEFTAAGRRLRVTRSPEFVRPKARGTGDRVVPAAVVLEELTGSSWTPLTIRADEAGLTIRRVLGLGLDQFSRVVLLPQGEFAAFLRATPDDRRAVLERLFDVSRFGQIETWLAAQRRAADHAADEAREQLRAAVARLEGVVDLVEGATQPHDLGVDLPALDVPTPQLPEVIATLRSGIQEIATARSAERDAADSLWREAEEAMRQALPAAAAYDRGVEARATIARLDDRAAELAREESRLAAHDQAWGIAGDLRALDRALAHRETCAEAAASARASAAQRAPRLLELDAESAAALAVEIATFTGHIHALADASDRLEKHGRVLHEAQDAVSAAHVRADDANLRWAEATRAVETFDALMTEAHTAAARAAALGLEDRELLRLQRLWEQVRDARGRHEAAAAHALAATNVANDAGAVLLDLQQRRVDGMAAELAEGLTPGSSCPVCGSESHPSPARPVDVVTPSQIAEARHRFEALREEAGRAAADMARWASTVAARESDLADDGRSLEDVHAARAEVQAELDGLGDVGPRVAAAEHGLRDARARVTQASQEQQLALTTAAQAQGVLDAARLTENALQTQLEAAGEGHADCPCRVWSSPDEQTDDSPQSLGHDGSGVTTTVRRHTRLVELLEGLRVADEAARQASHEAAEIARHVAERSHQCGFRSHDEARGALLAHDAARDLRTHLNEVRQHRATAETTLDDPAVAAALGGIRPDVTRLAAAAESAKTALLSAARVETVASTAARECALIGDQVVTLAAESGRRDDEASALSALADTVAGLGGDNVLRMRLSAFVLAGRLEKVVELANERLAVIASGRYRLAHTDALASAGRRSGLGLEVHDLWTGVTRDPATLSGGEAFMASLALALGLADAVHHEAGGVDLQTLFIDEGFGTLDDESLEQVMSVLDTLREGGRAVGVVSHVADLRGRIPTQLRVDKSPGGSTVTVLSESA